MYAKRETQIQITLRPAAPNKTAPFHILHLSRAFNFHFFSHRQVVLNLFLDIICMNIFLLLFILSKKYFLASALFHVERN